MAEKIFEVVIIGGGPAGLSAALALGRCLRNVLICDDEQYRNAYSQSMHGFLTRDGIHPAELRKIAREQLIQYETVQIKHVKVIKVTKEGGQFHLALENGEHVLARKLLLATGLRDQWPTIPGAKELYGRSIFHCPYCDGWEMRNQPLVAYGRGDKRGAQFALELLLWSKDVVLCSDGPSELSEKYRERLARHGILIYENRIVQLESEDGILKKVLFENGESLERRAIFFNTPSCQRSDLAAQLGCTFDENGGVIVDKREETDVVDLFVVGDSSRDVLQAIVAAGEGFQAAVAINTELIKEDLK